MRFAEFPLRDQRRARTRVKLVEALVARLGTRTLDEIAVAELCAEANIAPGTFFNHFPTKEDLLRHYAQLWSLRVDLVARRAGAEHVDPLAAIEALFATTAEDIARRPGVVLEIIARIAHTGAGGAPPPVDLVERLLFLDDAEDASTLSDEGLQAILTAWIARAVEFGSLPPETNVDAVVLGAASVFFGAPLLRAHDAPETIGACYARGLAFLWAGARAG